MPNEPAKLDETLDAEPYEPPKPRRLKRWVIAGASLLGVAVIAAVAFPLIQVGQEAAGIAWINGPDNLDSMYDPAKGLARLGGPENAARKLRFYLWLPRAVVPHRAEATMLLGVCGRPALESLLCASEDKDPRIRAAAAVSFGCEPLRAEAAVSVPVLIRAMKDVDPDVRWHAILALHFIGQPGQPATPLLIEIARGGCGREQKQAIQALGRIGPASPEVLSLLTTMLQDQATGHSAAKALGDLGSGARMAVPELIRAVDASSNWSDGRRHDFRVAAAEALKKIRGEEAKQ